jgi:N-acyl-D-amino-acid deacylase
VFDVKISGGKVLDGTGVPIVPADLGVSGHGITAIGDLSFEPAGETEDAAG